MAAWDWSTPLRILPAHASPIPAVATARLEDGRILIISGGGDGVLRRWDATTGEPVGNPLTGHIPAFVRLAKTIIRFRDLILNAVEHRLSNARSEATNTPRGYSPDAPTATTAPTH